MSHRYRWPPGVGDDDLFAATLQDRRFAGVPALSVCQLHGDVCTDEFLRAGRRSHSK